MSTVRPERIHDALGPAQPRPGAVQQRQERGLVQRGGQAERSRDKPLIGVGHCFAETRQGWPMRRQRRAPAIRFAVTPRQGASLPRLIRAVDQAVADWDALAGTEIPVVLHLQGRGWLDRWRSATRVR